MNIKKNIPLRVVSGIIFVILTVGIFLLSSQPGDDSNALSIPLSELFSNGEFNVIVHVLIRKIAHMAEFGLVGITGYVFLSTFTENMKVTALSSFAFSLLYAVSDEIHQYFVPGRSGLASDVLIDGLGALLGVIFIMLIFYFIRKRKQ